MSYCKGYEEEFSILHLGPDRIRRRYKQMVDTCTRYTFDIDIEVETKTDDDMYEILKEEPGFKEIIQEIEAKRKA